MYFLLKQKVEVGHCRACTVLMVTDAISGRQHSPKSIFVFMGQVLRECILNCSNYLYFVLFLA